MPTTIANTGIIQPTAATNSVAACFSTDVGSIGTGFVCSISRTADSATLSGLPNPHCLGNRTSSVTSNRSSSQLPLLVAARTDVSPVNGIRPQNSVSSARNFGEDNMSIGTVAHRGENVSVELAAGNNVNPSPESWERFE
jgi:hypothetical protein